MRRISRARKQSSWGPPLGEPFRVRLRPDATRVSRLIFALVLCGVLQARPASAQMPGADDLLDGNVLQEIWIHINAKDLEELRSTFQENTYYTCDVEWRGQIVHDVGIRSRGGGSRASIKPGFLLDFSKYVAGQEFLGLKSLVLDNAEQDPSFIKERVTMAFSRRMGLPAPRESHARVYLGSARELGGVYAVVEDIETPFLRRQFGDDAGYLYEYKYQDVYGFEDLGVDLSAYALRFEPKTRVTESPTALFGPIQTLVRAINEASIFDLEASLAPYLDLGNFLTRVAVENFIAEADGMLGYAGLNNFYLYRAAGSSLTQLIVWDKDNTFSWLEQPPWYQVETNVLMSKAYAVPGLRALYLQRILESADAADGWLEEEIVREADQIRGAVLEDPKKPYSNEAFDQAIEDLRRFARERGGIVRRDVSQIAPSLTRP